MSHTPTPEPHHPDEPHLAQAIRRRREELGDPIPEIASRAGVSAQTWRNYENGHTRVRRDKVRGVWAALGWPPVHETRSWGIPGWSHHDPDLDIDLDDEIGDGFTRSFTRPLGGQDFPVDMDEGEEGTSTSGIPHWGREPDDAPDSWSPLLAATLGADAARTFSLGVDVHRGLLTEDLEQLAHLPRGTHLGELEESWISAALPRLWLTRYDHEFCHYVLAVDEELCARLCTHPLGVGEPLVRTVAEEMVLHQILTLGHAVARSQGYSEGDPWEQWYLFLAGSAEDIDALYASNFFPLPEERLHIDHWFHPFPTPHIPEWVIGSGRRHHPAHGGASPDSSHTGGATVTELPRRPR